MKTLLLLLALSIGIGSAKAQCNVAVNDSLYNNFDYVLNAVNVVGQAPFQFTWTVMDGNGAPMPFTQNTAGDSITISALALQNSYGCVIYQLCMTDALMCSTCTQADTSALQVPFNCTSAFSSSIVGPNQIAITTFGNIPPFLIQQQFMQWNDGAGQSQGMPYMGPGTTIVYTPGAQNPSDKFYLCVMTILTNGGCISCDSVPYTMANLNELSIDLSLRPNPANDIMSVESDQTIESISILGITGAVLMEFNAIGKEHTEITVADLPKGIYIAKVQTKAGIALKRFMVQH